MLLLLLLCPDSTSSLSFPFACAGPAPRCRGGQARPHPRCQEVDACSFCNIAFKSRPLWWREREEKKSCSSAAGLPFSYQPILPAVAFQCIFLALKSIITHSFRQTTVREPAGVGSMGARRQR